MDAIRENDRKKCKIISVSVSWGSLGLTYRFLAVFVFSANNNIPLGITGYRVNEKRGSIELIVYQVRFGWDKS